MTNSLHLFYRKERPSNLILELPWLQDQCTLMQRRDKSTTFELHPVNTIRDNEGCASEWLTATQKSSQVLVAYKKPSGNSWPMVLGLPFLPKLWRYIRNTAFVCLSQDGFALGISSQAPFSHCIAWVVWRLVWVSSTVGSKIGSFKLVYRAKVEMRRADMRIRQARKFQSQGLGWTQHQFYCSYGVCQSAKLYFPPTQLGIFDSCNSFALHKQLSFMKDLICVFMCFPVLVCE